MDILNLSKNSRDLVQIAEGCHPLVHPDILKYVGPMYPIHYDNVINRPLMPFPQPALLKGIIDLFECITSHQSTGPKSLHISAVILNKEFRGIATVQLYSHGEYHINHIVLSDGEVTYIYGHFNPTLLALTITDASPGPEYSGEFYSCVNLPIAVITAILRDHLNELDLELVRLYKLFSPITNAWVYPNFAMREEKHEAMNNFLYSYFNDPVNDPKGLRRLLHHWLTILTHMSDIAGTQTPALLGVLDALIVYEDARNSRCDSVVDLVTEDNPNKILDMSHYIRKIKANMRAVSVGEELPW